jgi:hypothetical protein
MELMTIGSHHRGNESTEVNKRNAGRLGGLEVGRLKGFKSA